MPEVIEINGINGNEAVAAETVNAQAQAKEQPQQKPGAEQENAVQGVTETDAEIARLKKKLSEANSEAADWKRQLRARQTEEERKEAERQEEERRKDAEMAELRTFKRVYQNTERLVAIGLDRSAAESMAKALPEGVGDEYFEATRKALETAIQGVKTEALKKQPTLSNGATLTTPKDGLLDPTIGKYFGLN